MNRNLDAEPQLGTDFSTRVLDAADRLLARRRRRVRQGAGAFVLCAGIALAVVWRGFTAPPQGPSQSPALASLSQTGADNQAGTAAERDGPPDALSWFFPDAQSLARYDATDASDDNGSSDGAFFADDD